MSTKALKTELIAAIAMVLVAVLALSGSTYAWFASNNKVTASGMQVKATAEGGLLIGYAGIDGSTPIADSAWASDASTSETSATTLYPASTFPTSSNSSMSSIWFHATSSKVSSAAAKSGSYEKLVLTNGKDTVDNRYYYLLETFKIKTVSSKSTATSLKVSGVTVANAGSQELNRSLRVAIACGNNVALYAPVYTGESNINTVVCKDITAGGDAKTTDTAIALYATTSSGIIADTVTYSSPTVVRIYTWFEGEDLNSTTYNADKESVLNNLTVTVSFNATLSE